MLVRLKHGRLAQMPCPVCRGVGYATVGTSANHLEWCNQCRGTGSVTVDVEKLKVVPSDDGRESR